MSVSILAYGLGNLGSVINMFRRSAIEVRTISTVEEVGSSDRLLLPGIGKFDTGMRLLEEQGLAAAIRNFAASGRPLLGICLGMQLLLSSSEEGELPGLGLIPGRNIRFAEMPGRRVPHMGWNLVTPTRVDPLLAELPDESRFYFVHSYHAVPDSEDARLGLTEYGDTFVSMIRLGNVMGAQFHPEKSHAFGLRILQNFATL